ncbi:hypothetical protein BGX38DRAFT_1149200 [Terfezia claveryi]|nr:hypothetical protein BGX38DRAFT_1149200 [Terfezia claveryi]
MQLNEYPRKSHPRLYRPGRSERIGAIIHERLHEYAYPIISPMRGMGGLIGLALLP